MRPETEAVAEQVFVALADPSRRAVLAELASGGPATATDLADGRPSTRQARAKHLGLRADASGPVTLRVTGFDFDHVRALVDTSVVAALDAATSIDPRVRGVGRRTLADLLESYR